MSIRELGPKATATESSDIQGKLGRVLEALKDKAEDQLQDHYELLELDGLELQAVFAGMRLFYRGAVDLEPKGYVQVGYFVESPDGDTRPQVVAEYPVDGLGNVNGRWTIEESGQIVYHGYKAVLTSLREQYGDRLRLVRGHVQEEEANRG